MWRKRLARSSLGEIKVSLDAEERSVLKALPGQVRELIREGDPDVYRLFPPAYRDDPDQPGNSEREAEYRSLMGHELLDAHLRSLRIMEETAGACTLNDEQASAWLGALNEIRLVLGTKLDVTEDMEPLGPDDPNASLMALYLYLSGLQEELVRVLAEGG